MIKIILLIGFIPFIVSFFIAQYFGARKLIFNPSLSPNGKDTAKKLLPSFTIQQQKNWWELNQAQSNKQLKLNSKRASSHQLIDLAYTVHLCGLTLLSEAHEKSVQMRYKTMRFATVFPVFFALIIVFALLSAKIPPVTALCAIACALGLACATLIFNLTIEIEAAKRGFAQCKTSNLLPKVEQLKALETAVMGIAYLHALPPFLHRLVLFRPKINDLKK